MKICIFTGVFPPDIGGPALYAQKIAEGLIKREIGVKVITYSDQKTTTPEPYSVIRISKRYPRPIQYFLCFINLLRLAKDAEIIYTLGITTMGLPPLAVSKILRKKFIIRLGGDFLWERAVEKGQTNKSLRAYYEGLHSSFRVRIIKRILKGADRIIFTSRFQKDIYLKYFNIDEVKTAIILNPFPEVGFYGGEPESVPRQILYAGRFIKLKNLDRLIEAFGRVSRGSNVPTLKIIGQGPEKENLESRIKNLELSDRVIIEKPLLHSELLKEIRKSRFCVLPSLSEVTPNFALECIKLGKPVLLTKETGFYDVLKDDLIFIDPFDAEDIKNKMEFLLDDGNWNDYRQKISRINTSRSWENVIEENLKIFKNI